MMMMIVFINDNYDDVFFIACDEQTEYQCKKDGTCIPLSWKCDRINDCSDGADEVACEYNINLVMVY